MRKEAAAAAVSWEGGAGAVAEIPRRTWLPGRARVAQRLYSLPGPVVGYKA